MPAQINANYSANYEKFVEFAKTKKHRPVALSGLRVYQSCKALS
jgi:hypothetical protein